MTKDKYEATELRKLIDRVESLDAVDDDRFENLPDELERIARQMFDEGEVYLDCELWTQFVGVDEPVDVFPIFMIGVLFGSALEHDVPRWTEKDDAFHNGEFVLPEE